jgi:hypothetical protein
MGISVFSMNFFFRLGGTTKTYPETNSFGCWMKALKVDENGQNGLIFGDNYVFFGSKFCQK